VSVYNNRITLGTAAEIIVPAWSGPQEVHLHNMTKSSNEYIYVGGSAVGTADGIHIDPGEDLSFNVPPGDAIYAMSDPDGLDVGILILRK
jgi:hypothetical protein